MQSPDDYRVVLNVEGSSEPGQDFSGGYRRYRDAIAGMIAHDILAAAKSPETLADKRSGIAWEGGTLNIKRRVQIYDRKYNPNVGYKGNDGFLIDHLEGMAPVADAAFEQNGLHTGTDAAKIALREDIADAVTAELQGAAQRIGPSGKQNGSKVLINELGIKDDPLPSGSPGQYIVSRSMVIDITVPRDLVAARGPVKANT